ncbi:hypothetical protein BJV77DRAFT_1059137 [Russula vinacea]|nr:hypothetical protein BJV77DRAFT_1059137 [Russula vinacea]
MDSIRKFRFARHKGNAALVVKINKQRLIMEEVETFDDITPEDLAEAPEASPRYVVLSYNLVHKDGRTRLPSSSSTGPPVARPASSHYMRALSWISEHCTPADVDVSKCLEVRDGAEGLTKSILDAKLLS